MPHIILNSAADAIFGIDMEGLHVLQSVPARVVVLQTSPRKQTPRMEPARINLMISDVVRLIENTAVDAHGGTLVAARNSDRGMIFLVSFPYWEMSAKNQRRGPGTPPANQ